MVFMTFFTGFTNYFTSITVFNSGTTSTSSISSFSGSSFLFNAIYFLIGSYLGEGHKFTEISESFKLLDLSEF